MQCFDLTGKTALVTGGAGWLGKAFASGLAEAGAAVVITSRKLARAKQALAQLPADQGQRHEAVELDQLDTSSLAAGFEQALAAAGTIDVLVNNGLEHVGEDLTSLAFDDFARHQVNNAAYFELARRLRDHAVARARPASIINVGSMYGQIASYPEVYEGLGNASSVAYQVLKGGTIQMSRHLAVYWARDGVRVNCLSPGPFPDPAKAPEPLVERISKKCPLRRVGHPDELKGAIVFLASDASSYVTGHNLLVDGGWTAW